jgi:hypothetical protein
MDTSASGSFSRISRSISVALIGMSFTSLRRIAAPAQDAGRSSPK